MVKVKASDLTGSALDWAVSVAVENNRRFPIWIDGKPDSYANYSTDWGRSGPIIEREGISWHCDNKTSWHAYGYGGAVSFQGPTPLIAAMRCYVASKLGDFVDVPDTILC